MDPARELAREFGRWLLVTGVILAVVGAVLLFAGKLPLRLGRLPGDIAIEGRRGSFYFPIVTCLLLSVALTLVMWVVSSLRK
jgi:hypothetical protein